MNRRELDRLFWSPLPLEHTVDAEIDIGHNQLLMRHYVAPEKRKGASFDDTLLAYSHTELSKAQQKIATDVNRALKSQKAAKGSNNVDLEDIPPGQTTGTGGAPATSVRYLFDDNRLQYVNRFTRNVVSKFGLENELHALMEVCAIVYGCDDDDAREAWLSVFRKLDRGSLAETAEKLRGLLADAKEVAADDMLFSKKHLVPTKRLFPLGGGRSLGPSSVDPDDDLLGEQEEEDEGTLAIEEDRPVPNEEFAEYAPLYKSYAAYCRGQSPVVDLSLAKDNVGAFAIAAERNRWRRVIDTLVAEEYDKLDEVDIADAINLSNELQTLKLLDLKVGDIVAQTVADQKRRGVGEIGRSHTVGTMDAQDGNPTNIDPVQ